MPVCRTIALDAMGGDNGPSVVVPAAISFARKHADCRLLLVGQEEELKKRLPGQGLPDNVSLVHASQVVGMDEPPASALRGKKDSSMRVAINLVKSGEADACVSAGNTGALMATARFVLKTIPGVDRPAIITALPAVDGRTWVLDLGANIDSSAEHLLQFAIMGNELVKAVEGPGAPSIGLLNIGTEEIKGIESVKEAHQLLRNSGLNYQGYVEGDDVYLRKGLDIVVTDGFIGNVALKSSEGVAKMIRTFLTREFKRNLFTRLAAAMALPVLNGLKRRIDPRRYNGASLLGLRGIVVKSHGGADAFAFENAIGIARKEVEAGIAERISESVAERLHQKASA
ncbi:MAG: phosphate acyltransferase PlsX [Gammaproteobacteria bacterium]|nr:MAG: phosphate acyltransferase PlsX [Gammaproteobacteria bacterium]